MNRGVPVYASQDASGGSLVLYGLVFVFIGGAGLWMSLVGRPFRNRLARFGNGLSAAAVLVAGVVMVVVGAVQAFRAA